MLISVYSKYVYVRCLRVCVCERLWRSVYSIKKSCIDVCQSKSNKFASLFYILVFIMDGSTSVLLLLFFNNIDVTTNIGAGFI